MAAKHLLGQHDFTTFRDSECQAKSPIKTLDRLDIVRIGEAVEFAVEGRSFLHHQVRNMVGTLSHVGEGKWSIDDVAAALAAKDRTKGGITAPPMVSISCASITDEKNPPWRGKHQRGEVRGQRES
jgi:tRNA pseudouridine38-40 synthase